MDWSNLVKLGFIGFTKQWLNLGLDSNADNRMFIKRANKKITTLIVFMDDMVVTVMIYMKCLP